MQKIIKEDKNQILFPTVIPSVIEGVDITLPPDIERLSQVFKLDTLKDIQHEIQTPGQPNKNKVGHKISELTFKTRQDLRKKGVLQVTGRKLYVVGGIVRDWLINHFHGLANPHVDWDLATDASVESLKLIIRAGIEKGILHPDTHLYESGKKFGNVHLVISGNTYEITTFPFSGYPNAPRMYLDSLRRNFNVNALYYSIEDQKIYDYHAGIADVYRKSPSFIGKLKNKLKEEENGLYPLVYARMYAKMNNKDHFDNEIEKELKKFIIPKNISKKEIYEEFQKGIKQSIDKRKYINVLYNSGLLEQIFPGIKLNHNPEIGDMTMFPLIVAQILKPNWNNLGHLSETLHFLEFPSQEIHDIMFLIKLPHYINENDLKKDRLHTGLSERAIEQFVKTNNFARKDWIMKMVRNGY